MKFPAFDPIDLKNNFELHDLRMDHISADPEQPRKIFIEEALNELSHSIKKYGVIQPIVVKEIANQQYQIIAGERRWRACRMLNLKTIPAIIKSRNDKDDSAVALVENLQREALNPIEMAKAFSKLSQDHQLSHDEIAGLVGKSRAFVTNTVRLLNLSDSVKDHVISGQLEMGHARSLLTLSMEQQESVSEHIIEKNLSVRETEKFSQSLKYLDKNTQEASMLLAKKITETLNKSVDVIVAKSGVVTVNLKFTSTNDVEKWLLEIGEFV